MNLVLKTSIKLVAYSLNAGLSLEDLLKKLKVLYPKITIEMTTL